MASPSSLDIYTFLRSLYSFSVSSFSHEGHVICWSSPTFLTTKYKTRSLIPHFPLAIEISGVTDDNTTLFMLSLSFRRKFLTFSRDLTVVSPLCRLRKTDDHRNSVLGFLVPIHTVNTSILGQHFHR